MLLYKYSLNKYEIYLILMFNTKFFDPAQLIIKC